MSISIRPINILAGRFASLPPHSRMAVATKLLRWLEEAQAVQDSGGRALHAQAHRNLVERFGDEVEAAYRDEVSQANLLAVRP